MNKNLDILKNINILYLEDDENLLKHTSDILEDFVANNYPDSNINNQYEVASNMKDAELPDNFIKNFIKSYD